MSDSILYEVKGKTAVITINLPKLYNALDFEQYLLLDQLVQRAGRNPDTVATIVQASGKFFSAGANVQAGSRASEQLDLKGLTDPDQIYEKTKTTFHHSVGARNLSLSETFFNHPKVLVIALNGPVIGLTAALVALADFIYALDSAFLLAPFANLGLVSEGASSWSLVQRLGLSKANEALLGSKAIYAKDLLERGLVNKLWKTSDFKSTEEFNAKVEKIVQDTFWDLEVDSLAKIKQLIRNALHPAFSQANAAEAFGVVERFASGKPQKRFAGIASGKLKHKL